MDAQGRHRVPDPAEVTEVAHQTAAILVGTGRAAHDPEVTARLVTLVDDLGLSTVADLWSARPARSLPGALWRLYALREWVRRSPEQAQPRVRGRHPVHRRRPRRGRDRRAARARTRCSAWPTRSSRGSSRATSRWRWSGPRRSARWSPRGGAELRPDARDAADPRRRQRPDPRAASMLATGEDLEACARLWRLAT